MNLGKGCVTSLFQSNPGYFSCLKIIFRRQFYCWLALVVAEVAEAV